MLNTENASQPLTKRQFKQLITITDMDTKDKLYDLRQTIDDLVAIGPDYAHFMNAQIAHKNLKKIKKLLEYIG